MHDPTRFIDEIPESFKETFQVVQKAVDKEGKNREFLFKYLMKVFPGIKREVLDVYDSYLAHNKYQSQRKHAIYRCFLREKLDLKRKTEKLIIEHLSEKLLKASRARMAEEQAALNKELRLELEAKRKEFNKLQQELEKKQRLKEEQTRRELELQKAKFEKHAQFVKLQAEVYKQAKMEEMKLKMIEKDRLERDQQKLLKEQVQKNAPEVYKRQAIAEYAIIQKLENKKMREDEEEERRVRIQEAIERYKDRPLVERDEHRMMSDTEALNLRKEAKEAKPLFTNPGFYDDRLMADPRFKLQTRLYEAGLNTNSYAKELLNKMSRPNN